MGRLAYYAKPELRERLVLVHNGLQGYSMWVREMLAALPGPQQGTPKGKEWVNAIIGGRRSVPMWAVLNLTRIAEGELEISDLTAHDLSSNWFEIKEATPHD